MRRLVLTISLAAGVAASASEAIPEKVAVPLDLSMSRPAIEMKIGGKGPFKLLVDTGSGAELILDQDLADELGLKATGTKRIGDPNTPEAIEAKVSSVASVQVGALTIEDVEILSWKREAIGMKDVPRGVVGLGLFAPHPVTLDYPGSKLIVEPEPLPEADGKRVLVASFEDGIPSIPITVAGNLYRAHLDSGSSGFIGLPAAAADDLPLETPPVQVGRARTASGDYPVSEARLRGDVHIGDITLPQPKIRFIGLPVANLGSDLLRAMVVTIDRKNERVRLVATGKLEPTDKPRFGVLSHGMKDGTFPVDDVAAGSAAEAAGLKAGDRIVRLNDRAVAEMSPFQLSQALLERPLVIALTRDGAPVQLTIAKTPAASN